MRNKAIYYLIIVIIFSSVQLLFSQTVSQEMVNAVARNFLTQHQQMVLRKKLMKTDLTVSRIQILKEPKAEILLAHIINLNPKGFIVLSNDQSIEPVIAYSFNSNFSMDTTSNNILYHMIIKDMKLRKEALVEIDEQVKEKRKEKWNQLVSGGKTYFNSADFQQWPPEGSTTTSGWVETTWDQHSPYNDFCPLDPNTGSRCVVGCVATALAQVIHYHKYVGDGFFDINDEYTTSNGINIDSDSSIYYFPSFERLNSYIDSLKFKYQIEIELNDIDIAALNFACGISVQMNYSSNSSGATTENAKNAFLNKFGFSTAKIKSSSDNIFYETIQLNMMNSQPCILEITELDGGLPVGAHEIICDGYNSYGEYHLNFGWGPTNPDEIILAWYYLPDEIPARYNVLERAILNIQDEPYLLNIFPLISDFLGVANDTTECQCIYLENNSTSTINIDTVRVPYGYSIFRSDSNYSSMIGPFSIVASEIDSINIVFCPPDSGNYNNHFIIRYGDNNAKSVILNGYSYLSGTIIPGGNVSGIWTHEFSPYYVTGNISVHDEGLKIRPGVDIRFMGRFLLSGNGKLNASGNVDSLITFLPLNTQKGWNGIGVTTGDTLRYCEIAYSFDIGVDCGGSPVIKNNIIRNNVNSHSGGGGIKITSGCPIITENMISNNKSHSEGGGIFIKSSSPRIIRNIIVNNREECGGSGGGGISHCFGGKSLIINNTISNNSAAGQGGGVLVHLESQSRMINNIIFSNGSTNGSQVTVDNLSEIIYCDIGEFHPGIGNINQDPLFISPPGGIGLSYNGWQADWSIQPESPCWDSGIFKTDMGAYGSIPPAINVLSDTIDFGIYPQWSGHLLEKKIAIFNYSTNEQLSITDISGENEIFSITDSFPIVIDPGEIYECNISMVLDSSGDFIDTLQITSNAQYGDQSFICTVSILGGGTVIDSGSISGILNFNSSPYYIIGDITVGSNSTLEIEPGCKLYFLNGSKIVINGTLTAIGTSENRILFDSPDSLNHWKGLKFSSAPFLNSILKYCIVRNAIDSNYQGAAIYSSNSSNKLELLNSRIENNSCYYGGAGIFIIGGTLIIKNCVISNNKTNHVGGGGAGIRLEGVSNAKLINNTVVCNVASGGYGGGLIIFSSSVLMRNNIFYYNLASIGNQLYGSANVEYCDIQGGYTGSGNIDLDPLFINSLNNDFHIQADSPCINAGTPDTTGLNLSLCDLNGKFRVWNGRIDIGAYEYGAPQLLNYTYTFPQQAWYMISLPIIPQDSTVTTLFPSALNGTAYHWNSSTQIYNPVIKMEPKKGYWLPISETSSSTVSGVPVNSFTEHFSSAGWYMLGSVPGSVNFTNPNDNPDGMVLTPAYTWDEGIGNYITADTLKEKIGYWIAVFGACDLTVDNTGGLSKSSTIARAQQDLFFKQYGYTPPKPPAIDWDNGEVLQIPTEFTLKQNYPNPFNPTTTIAFDLPKTSRVEIVIYNVLGQEVISLVDKEYPAGKYKIVWDGKNNLNHSISSGVYLCRIKAGEFSALKKLVFIR